MNHHIKPDSCFSYNQEMKRVPAGLHPPPRCRTGWSCGRWYPDSENLLHTTPPVPGGGTKVQIVWSEWDKNEQRIKNKPTGVLFKDWPAGRSSSCGGCPDGVRKWTPRMCLPKPEKEGEEENTEEQSFSLTKWNMTRNKHSREQKTRQCQVLLFSWIQVIRKLLWADDLQTHPGLSVCQTQLKVQQGFGVDTQLWAQHLHQRRVVLLCLDRGGARRINLGLKCWENARHSSDDHPNPPWCNMSVSSVHHRTVLAAEDASPDDADPITSSSCTAVAMIGTLQCNKIIAWRKCFNNPTNTCLFAPYCCFNSVNFPNVGSIKAFNSKRFVLAELNQPYGEKIILRATFFPRYEPL